MKIEQSVQEIWPFEHFKISIFFINMAAATLKIYSCDQTTKLPINKTEYNFTNTVKFRY